MNKIGKISKLVLSLLIASQAIMPGYMRGMEEDSSSESSSEQLSYAKSFGQHYSQDKERLINYITQLHPIQKIAQGSVKGAKLAAPFLPFAYGALSLYDLLWSNILPNWLTLPGGLGLAAFTGFSAYKTAQSSPTAQYIVSELNTGLQQEGFNIPAITARIAPTIRSGAQLATNVINPTDRIIKPAYRALKNAGETVVRDALYFDPNETVTPGAVLKKVKDNLVEETVNATQARMAQELRGALEIPANQSITVPVVTKKLRTLAQNDVASTVRDSLGIPADQPADARAIMNHMRTTGEAQVAQATRNALGIPADQPVDASAIAQRVNSAAYKALWQYGSTTAILTAAAPIAVITAWFSGKYVMHKVQNPEPKVFHSTSEKGYWQRFKNWALGHKDITPEMIYAKELETRLNNITKATIVINKKIKEGKTNAFYRNTLLEGPPGTGKTYFARNMMRQVHEAIGMQWRETDGPALLKAGIPYIDEMFDWAEKQYGVILFIDEADVLFSDRDQLGLNTEQTIVLNHLLSKLGDRSNKYMIIMTTNRKVVFDAAMQRRIDDLVTIPLPAQNERARVLQLYRNTILLDEKENSATFVASAHACLHDEKIKTIAQGTNGLSNGDLQGIISTIKSEADITDDGLITHAIVDMVVQRYIDKNREMNSGKKVNNNKRTRNN